jgi:hypothetical protein
MLSFIVELRIPAEVPTLDDIHPPLFRSNTPLFAGFQGGWLLWTNPVEFESIKIPENAFPSSIDLFKLSAVLRRLQCEKFHRQP